MTDQEIAENYAKMLEDALRQSKPEANFDWKRMFGGAGYYVDEQIFAAWYGKDELALKLSPNDTDTLKKLGGSEGPETMSKQYTYLPLTIQNDEKQFDAWVGKSIAYVASQPKKKKKK